MNAKISVTLDEVKKIARLARLRLNKEELNYYQGQLNSIMNMIEIIQDIDCSETEPIYSLAIAENIMRADKTLIENTISDIFANSPKETQDISKETNMFIVPKMVE